MSITEKVCEARVPGLAYFVYFNIKKVRFVVLCHKLQISAHRGHWSGNCLYEYCWTPSPVVSMQQNKFTMCVSTVIIYCIKVMSHSYLQSFIIFTAGRTDHRLRTVMLLRHVPHIHYITEYLEICFYTQYYSKWH
jgi:hypothetical protein